MLRAFGLIAAVLAAFLLASGAHAADGQQTIFPGSPEDWYCLNASGQTVRPSSGTCVSNVFSSPESSWCFNSLNQPVPIQQGSCAVPAFAPAVFNVGDYGAVGNGVKDDTTSFVNALSACAAAGGGSVELAAKRYVVNGNLTVSSGCQVYCPAPLLGAEGPLTPLNFTLTPFTVLLNPANTITLNAGSAWRGCAVLQKNASTAPATTRDLLNLAAAFAGTAFNVGGDVEIDDTFIGGFQLGLTTTNLHGDRLRMNRVNIDANQCAQFDSIFDVPDIFGSMAQSATSWGKVVTGTNNTAHTGRGGLGVSATGCGTGPSISSFSSDFDGVVTEGTTATGCTINFSQGFNNTPLCTVSSQSALTAFAYSVGANTITVTHGSASNSLINWHCASREPQ